MRRTLRFVGGLVALFGATAAQAQGLALNGACLPRADAEALVVFALPSLVEGVATKCAPTLPAAATLRTEATNMAERYGPEAERAWPKARAAFERLSDETITELFGEEVTRTMIEVGMVALIVERIAVKDCATIDAAMGALAPLPARNVARLVTVAIDVFAARGKRLPITLCPAEGA